MHPCDDVSLEGAVEAARLHLIEPILVGPPDRIRGVAESAGSGYQRHGDRAVGTQPRLGREGGGVGDRRTRGGADEGQPPYR